YFAARLCSKVTGRNCDWFATFGLVTEGMAEFYEDLFTRAKTQFPDIASIADKTEAKDPIDGGFREIAYLLGSAFHVPRGPAEEAALRLSRQMLSEATIMPFINKQATDVRLLIDIQDGVAKEIERLTSITRTNY